MTQQPQPKPDIRPWLSPLSGLAWISWFVLAWLIITGAVPQSTVTWGFLATFILLAITG